MRVVAAELGYYECTYAEAGDDFNANAHPMFFSDWTCTGNEAAFADCD
jgi:hypothetical protein